jgi:DNA-binding transcriptional LysR family regulator
MDIRQLRHFLAAVEHGSLLRAAEAVHVSQQGLSKSIRALELSLGATLLDRGRFGVKPTAFGLALAQRARVICGYSKLAEDDIKALKVGDAGTVAIGIGPYFERQVIPAVVLKLSKLRPNVSIRLYSGPTSRLLEWLASGEIDFSVSTPSNRMAFPPEVDVETLFSEREVAIVRAKHPLAKRRECSLKDALSYPWIMSSVANTERDRVTRMLREIANGWPPRVVMVDSVDTIVDLLRQEDFVHLSTPGLLRALRADLSPVVIKEITDRRCGMLGKRRGETPMPAVELAMSLVKSECRRALTADRG